MSLVIMMPLFPLNSLYFGQTTDSKFDHLYVRGGLLPKFNTLFLDNHLTNDAHIWYITNKSLQDCAIKVSAQCAHCEKSSTTFSVFDIFISRNAFLWLDLVDKFDICSAQTQQSATL